MSDVTNLHYLESRDGGVADAFCGETEDENQMQQRGIRRANPQKKLTRVTLAVGSAMHNASCGM